LVYVTDTVINTSVGADCLGLNYSVYLVFLILGMTDICILILFLSVILLHLASQTKCLLRTGHLAPVFDFLATPERLSEADLPLDFGQLQVLIFVRH